MAARLRITPESLNQALLGAMGKRFEPALYRGMLEGFDGPRWWRSGVEALLWDATNARSFDTNAVRSLLQSTMRDPLQFIDIPDPVVCIDKNQRRLPTLFSTRDAVRIQPDDWPAFADPAWTSIELARNDPGLGALVVEQDRDALSGKAEVR